MFEPFYALSGAPFQLSPDPEFFYGSRVHKRASAYLHYGLYQGEGFIMLTGEVGAGKTTLIRDLLRKLDPRKVVAAQLVSTQLDADNLLRAVATAFGLEVRDHDKARLLAQLEAFLLSLAPEGKRALLIVDEAQNLSPHAVEELRMLSNFQLGSRALLQSFLVGQPELRQLMRTPGMQQLRQRVLASYHLGPLDPEETRAYIEHRLRRVSWKGDPHFDDNVFPLLHRHSAGIPRRLNTLCARTLLAAYLSEKHRIDAPLVEQVISEFAEELGDGACGAQRANGQEPRQENHQEPQPAQKSGDPLERLETRIISVEKTLELTLNLLRQVIRKREPAESAQQDIFLEKTSARR